MKSNDWVVSIWIPYEGAETLFRGTREECLSYMKTVPKKQRYEYELIEELDMDAIWREVDAL